MTKAVRLTEHIDGGWFEDGWRDYPAKGEVFTTNDDHADQLVLSGRAEHVNAKDARADAKKPETATAKDDPETRAAASKASASK